MAGAGRGYLHPYRQVIDEIWKSGSWDSLRRTAAQEWPSWLIGQLPYALTLGAFVGGLWLMWRSRFLAEWRDTESLAPQRRIESQVKNMTRRDDRPPATSVNDLTLRLGVDTHTGKPCVIPGRALRQHAFVAGATGYGKTRSIERLVYELVVSPHARPLNIPFLFADMKGDPELAEALRGAAHEAGRRFRLVTVTGHGNCYNPIRQGTAEQVRSRIVECLDQVAGGGFSEPHHREAAEEFLLYCVRALDDLVAQPHLTEQFTDGVRPWRRDLPDLARLMTIKGLSNRLNHFTGPVGQDISQYLDYLQDEAKDLRRSIPGLATRVRNLVSGDARRILTEHPDGIDLYESIQAGDIVLLSLASATDARAARQIGSLFLTDLGSVGDRLLADRWGASGGLFIAGVDEFSALGGSTMAGLFQRIRAAGGGLILCTQDMADLTEVGEGFAAAVMTNTNILILHRQKAAAETIAELLGTRQGWEETVQVQEDITLLGSATVGSGVGSLRRVDRFKVHPNELRELGTGQAVVAVGNPTDSVQTVRMLLAPRHAAPQGPEPQQQVLLTKHLSSPPTLEQTPAPDMTPPALPPTLPEPWDEQEDPDTLEERAMPPEQSTTPEPEQPEATTAPPDPGGKPNLTVKGSDMWE
ncbi:TraM recognition domain-containing protein [Streptomyces sp. NPDC048188]|uniref:type IV secretory system conjugative DNA transfer family protein n=1 Tax=Streptomyces sp. NPDC048188 TaxID=3155749 RepID=UPI00342F2AE3